MSDALDGVRVLEFAGWMAGPGAAARMADLGADVIKVEPSRGDAMRGAIRQPELTDRPPLADSGSTVRHVVSLRGCRSRSRRS